MSTRHVTTAAMRHGTQSEGTAAQAYSKVYIVLVSILKYIV